jgi:hypothetical protein
MAKALGAIRTGGMAALILAWALGGEVKLLAVVLLALFVVHHAIALAAAFVAYAAIELAFCTWIERHCDSWGLIGNHPGPSPSVVARPRGNYGACSLARATRRRGTSDRRARFPCY